MAKILEKGQILLNKDKLSTKNNQHAFAHGRSTLSALINISENWLNDTDNKLHERKSIHALFVDFSKAFDLVDHSVLLNKLKQLNINRLLAIMAMDPEFPDRPHTTSETSWSSLYKKSLPCLCPASVRNFTAII